MSNELLDVHAEAVHLIDQILSYVPKKVWCSERKDFIQVWDERTRAATKLLTELFTKVAKGTIRGNTQFLDKKDL